MDQPDNQRAASAPEVSIVGAWCVDVEGAPFMPHVALFHADGTLLIHNPDVASPDSSDSLGVGAWQVDGARAQKISGVFEEFTADRATGQEITRLRVTFTLTLEEANAFTGPAQSMYYALDGTELYDQPHPVMLTGTRIQP